MSLFAIGIYQAPGTYIFAGAPVTPPTPILIQPGVTQVDTYTLSWYAIRDPMNTTLTGPQVVGTDITGMPAVRGYSQMEWDWTYIKPDQWYAFYRIWRLSRLEAGPHTGKVMVQWPDPESGTIVTASARWDKMSPMTRSMPTYDSVSFIFSHLSIDDSVAAGSWMSTS